MKPALPALILLTLTGAILADTSPGRPERLVRISFYHDADLNGQRDAGEPELTNLRVSAAGEFRPAARGAILVPAGRTILLHVDGRSPAGKPLTVAVRTEEILMLPQFSHDSGERDSAIGLADGFLTSPLRPGQLHEQRGALRAPRRVPDDDGAGARIGVHDAHAGALGDGLLDRDRAPGVAANPADLDPHAAGRIRDHCRRGVLRGSG